MVHEGVRARLTIEASCNCNLVSRVCRRARALDVCCAFSFRTAVRRARPSVRDIFANGSFTRLWRCYFVIIERASWSSAAPDEAFIFR